MALDGLGGINAGESGLLGVGTPSDAALFVEHVLVRVRVVIKVIGSIHGTLGHLLESGRIRLVF